MWYHYLVGIVLVAFVIWTVVNQIRYPRNSTSGYIMVAVTLLLASAGVYWSYKGITRPVSMFGAKR
jgi:hypothetical protein